MQDTRGSSGDNPKYGLFHGFPDLCEKRSVLGNEVFVEETVSLNHYLLVLKELVYLCLPNVFYEITVKHPTVSAEVDVAVVALGS